ncbi:MAG: hypothetical protein V2I46_00985 [Bacteroides sp.]|jgi:hypothetical protein|nr:hypothetical protein [Bacteroides sp.]
MKKLKRKKNPILPLVLILFLSLGPWESFAQEKFIIAGKGTAAFKRRERSNIGDLQEHMLSLAESEGVSLSTGETPFMDGAYFDSFVISDLVKYSGPFQGYFMITKNEDTIFARYEGQLTTSPDESGQPQTSLSLTFSWIKGTGSYTNIQGGGSMIGHYISNIIYTFEWQGEYWIPD